MTPVIVEKRNALAASKACHSKRNLRALRAACRKVWQTTRRCAKDYRLQPCSQIRSVAVAGNINKEENSPSEVRHRRLRWNTGCNATQRYLQKKHWTPSNALLCWRSLTVIQPLNSSTRHLPLPGKGPGNDSIPTEALKCGKENIISELHEILCLCWREGEVKQDMTNANIVSLYKNKGDRSDWNNYQSPMSHNYYPIMNALYSYLTNLLVLAWQSIIKPKLTVASPP